MTNYQTIYKGSIDTGQQDEATLLALSEALYEIDLPWANEVVLSSQGDRSILSFCALFVNKEKEVRDALVSAVRICKKAFGQIYCYGSHSHDIRRFLVKDGRLYEQRATIEYEEPGMVIFCD